MQRRVQQLDLFSCQIDKGENELGLCTRVFFDPADEDEKEPGVFITEIVEGGAAHKLGCIHVFDQIIKIGDINLIGLDEEKIFSSFKKMENCVYQIEIGREPPEVKSELIILLELSEERKKYFMDSFIVQEKVGDITIVKGEARNYKTLTISCLWMTRQQEFVVVALKKLIEENQKRRTHLKAIYDKANNLQDKHKKYMNTSEVDMEHQPDKARKKGTFSPSQLLAPEDINSGKKEEIIVEEEISSAKPKEGKVQRRFSWFCNIKECNWQNIFCFKKHDKQVKNVKEEECARRN